MTPLEALARTFWINGYRNAGNWPAAWAWYNDARSAPYIADSMVGQCVAKAERILVLIDKAGLKVEPKSIHSMP